MRPASRDTQLSEIHPSFYMKNIYIILYEKQAQLGEILPWARWDLSKVGWKFPIWT